MVRPQNPSAISSGPTVGVPKPIAPTRQLSIKQQTPPPMPPRPQPIIKAPVTTVISKVPQIQKPAGHVTPPPPLPLRPQPIHTSPPAILAQPSLPAENVTPASNIPKAPSLPPVHEPARNADRVTAVPTVKGPTGLLEQIHAGKKLNTVETTPKQQPASDLLRERLSKIRGYMIDEPEEEGKAPESPAGENPSKLTSQKAGSIPP